MSAIFSSAISQVLSGAEEFLRQPQAWPTPSTGLAYRMFNQTGTPKPVFMDQSLKTTSASLLRRTPELAAFGYVLNSAGEEMLARWLEAFELLRGRDIFPADRQSFIFNPVEILGIAAGVTAAKVPEEHRGWFTDTIIRGISQDQFKSALSKLAAGTALAAIDQAKAQRFGQVVVDPISLATPELIVATGISLAFRCVGFDADLARREILSRAITQPVPIADYSDAVTVSIVLRRAAEDITLGDSSSMPEDVAVTLCRRFPLFVDRLKKRHGGRDAFVVMDEYDVQDLMHAILKLHFDDVRPEEHTPSYAGTSSRTDFLLPMAKVAIEVKMTRQNLGQKEVANELIIDVARYSKMDNIETLVCIVYDPSQRCFNPTALEKDVEDSSTRLKVRAVVCPHGL